MTEGSWAANQAKTEPIPPSPAHGSESPGDARGVPVVSSDAAEGTSEASAPVDEAVTALAREGLADGEPDNRTPPTSTF